MYCSWSVPHSPHASTRSTASSSPRSGTANSRATSVRGFSSTKAAPIESTRPRRLPAPFASFRRAPARAGRPCAPGRRRSCPRRRWRARHGGRARRSGPGGATACRRARGARLPDLCRQRAVGGDVPVGIRAVASSTLRRNPPVSDESITRSKARRRPSKYSSSSRRPGRDERATRPHGARSARPGRRARARIEARRTRPCG